MIYCKKLRIMGNVLSVFLLLSLFSFLMAGEEVTIIENPAKPLNEKAGRVVQLKEVFHITDESGEDDNPEVVKYRLLF